MSYGVLLNLVVISLLMVAILYCGQVSRKLSLLRKEKSELNDFILHFNKSIIDAEENIRKLKELSGDSAVALHNDIEKARFLASDLSFLMAKGEEIAETLEKLISHYKSFKMGANIKLDKAGNINNGDNKEVLDLIKRAKTIKEFSQNKDKVDFLTPEKKKVVNEAIAQIISAKRKNDLKTASNSN